MASKRRGGFRTPELGGTLGSLVKSTLQQAGVVRDALARGAREGRARLDDARAARRRTDALAELGEVVLDLIRRGEIDLAELPEARDLVRDLDQIDAESDGEHERMHAHGHAHSHSHDRDRFDSRGSRDEGTVSSGARSKPAPRKGGITFDDDDANLADYMHPDDVPAKK